MSNIINFKNKLVGKEQSVGTREYNIDVAYINTMIDLGLVNDTDIEDGIKWLQSNKRYNIKSKEQDEIIDELIRQLHYRKVMLVPKHLIIKTQDTISAKCPICSTIVKFDEHFNVFCHKCGQKLEI